MTDLIMECESESYSSDSSYQPECLHPLPVKDVEPLHFECEYCECTCVDCEYEVSNTSKCQHDSAYICDYCEVKYVDDIEQDEMMNHGDFIDDSFQPDEYSQNMEITDIQLTQQMNLSMSSSNSYDADNEQE